MSFPFPEAGRWERDVAFVGSHIFYRDIQSWRSCDYCYERLVYCKTHDKYECQVHAVIIKP
jgi:hypothetical protein